MRTDRAYDVVVLGIMLPGLNGYDICKQMRAAGDWTPVLMLSAKDGECDQVDAFDLGADDYLTKPFSFPVFVARLRSLIRRGGVEGPPRWSRVTGTSRVAAAADPGEADWATAAHEVLQETARLEHLVADLLLLARLESAVPLCVERIGRPAVSSSRTAAGCGSSTGARAPSSRSGCLPDRSRRRPRTPRRVAPRG
ncbi:MAG: two component transcriptional regulator, winged helix family [Nocardioides sp.]|nr:two component transcriptional regulator, winged helix family [Nocardioides sp.]